MFSAMCSTRVVALEFVDQRLAPIGPVRDHRDPAVRGERQQALLRLAVEDVVGELHEVERLGAHDPLQLPVPPAVRRGDADMAHAAGRALLLEHRQMLLPIDQIVHLHQIEAIEAPERLALAHLGGAVAEDRRPDLGGREKGRGALHPLQAPADDRFGRAVHGRAVDHAAALVEERLQHGRPVAAQTLVLADIEGDPGAHADGGNAHPARRDRAGTDRIAGRRDRRRRPDEAERPQGAHPLQQSAAGWFDFVRHALPDRPVTLGCNRRL
jgi:hypothetical protein